MNNNFEYIYNVLICVCINVQCIHLLKYYLLMYKVGNVYMNYCIYVIMYL